MHPLSQKDQYKYKQNVFGHIVNINKTNDKVKIETKENISSVNEFSPLSKKKNRQTA